MYIVDRSPNDKRSNVLSTAIEKCQLKRALLICINEKNISVPSFFWALYRYRIIKNRFVLQSFVNEPTDKIMYRDDIILFPHDKVRYCL